MVSLISKIWFVINLKKVDILLDLIIISCVNIYYVYFRKKTITTDKVFYNKQKTVTYNADVWLKTEKYFTEVDTARAEGSKIQVQILDDLYLASAIWGDVGRRWTGIHAFSVYGLVKPKSGVNMDEMGWAMLVENFPKVKDVLEGKSVDLSACMRSADYEEYDTVQGSISIK